MNKEFDTDMLQETFHAFFYGEGLDFQWLFQILHYITSVEAVISMEISNPITWPILLSKDFNQSLIFSGF